MCDFYQKSTRKQIQSLKTISNLVWQGAIMETGTQIILTRADPEKKLTVASFCNFLPRPFTQGNRPNY